MPYSGVPDLGTAWQVVRDAGRANGALIVDVWHWARAGMTTADLAGVPADRIVSVQLCDVLAEPMQPPRSESLGHRLPPGRGHGDAVGLVRALQSAGVRPAVIAVEVISDELVGQRGGRRRADRRRRRPRGAQHGALTAPPRRLLQRRGPPPPTARINVSSADQPVHSLPTSHKTHHFTRAGEVDPRQEGDRRGTAAGAAADGVRRRCRPAGRCGRPR